MGNWAEKRKQWRRRQLSEATHQNDFRPSWVIIQEALKREEERRQLFGYVKLKSGEMITLGEARSRDIGLDDVLAKFPPEAERDEVDTCIGPDGNIEHHSKGEVRAGRDYPSLKIPKGDVLIDHKSRYLHPTLRFLK